MFFSRRFLWSFGLPIASILGFELIIWQPRFFVAIIPALIALCFVACFSIKKNYSAKLPRSLWYIFISPALLILGASSYAFLIVHQFSRHALALGIAFLLWLFFETLFLNLVATEQQQASYAPHTLENVINYLSVLSIFFISTACFGLTTLLDIPRWITPFPIFIIAFFITNQIFLFANIASEQTRTIAIICALMFTELFLTISLLPFHLSVAGALLTLFWYEGVGLTRAFLLGPLTYKMLKRYLITGAILLALLFIPVRWI